jgi:hypothetical protein
MAEARYMEDTTTSKTDNAHLPLTHDSIVNEVSVHL